MGPRIDVRDVLVVVPHLIVTGTLVAMTVMQIPSTRAQVDSGYVPSWFGIELVMLGLAVVLAAVVAIEVGIWLRTGRRRGLLIVDGVVFIASWTALMPFLFASLLPLVVMGGTPIAAVVLAVAGRREPTERGVSGA